MAINKERLSEIVREKKTFWWCQPYADSFIVREIRQPRVEVVVKDKYCVLIENDKEYLAEFEHLTEDKEDAEELAEFGNITKTERLPYVSYEEFSNGKVVEFVSNKLLYELKKCGEKIYISYRTYIDDSIWEIIFEQPLTKENYDNARRICVKLFRGESV